MMFESFGIPCSHIMCVMHFDHIHAFPSSLICKRWLKDAKSSFLTCFVPSEIDPDMMKIGHFGDLSGCYNKLCELGLKDVHNFKFVKDELLKLIESLQKCLHLGGDLVGHPSSMTNDMKNPNVVKTKGALRKKKQKKTQQCSNCDGIGHYMEDYLSCGEDFNFNDPFFNNTEGASVIFSQDAALVDRNETPNAVPKNVSTLTLVVLDYVVFN